MLSVWDVRKMLLDTSKWRFEYLHGSKELGVVVNDEQDCFFFTEYKLLVYIPIQVLRQQVVAVEYGEVIFFLGYQFFFPALRLEKITKKKFLEGK